MEEMTGGLEAASAASSLAQQTSDGVKHPQREGMDGAMRMQGAPMDGTMQAAEVAWAVDGMTCLPVLPPHLPLQRQVGGMPTRSRRKRRMSVRCFQESCNALLTPHFSTAGSE